MTTTSAVLSMVSGILAPARALDRTAGPSRIGEPSNVGGVPSGGSMSQVTRRELLKSAAVLGTAATLSPALGRPAHAQTTQKQELVVAQSGDISSSIRTSAPPPTTSGGRSTSSTT